MNIPNEDADFDPFANGPGKRKAPGSGKGVAWLALLLALAVLGFNAWDWWMVRNQAQTGDELATRLDTMQRVQAGFESRLDTLQAEADDISARDPGAELEQIRRELQTLQSRQSELGLRAADNEGQFDALNAAMLSLQRRIDSLETGVAALAVRGDREGSSLDIAEVEYLLRMAGVRLALYRDADSADRALHMADQQLETLGDPLYVPVRRRIMEARSALAAAPGPDEVDLSTRIEALQQAVHGLPFPGEAPAVEVLAEAEEPGIWARIKAALAPLVTVRRRVDERDLLSLEDRDFLRQALWLQLESARLALVRDDQQVWEQSLQRAISNLLEHFDEAALPVLGARQELEALRGVVLVPEMPDISAPAAQLRLLREGRSPAADAQAVESPGPQPGTTDGGDENG